MSTTGQTSRHTFLLCSPEHYVIDYIINPWMEKNFHGAKTDKAMGQWEAFRDALAARANVVMAEPLPPLPDYCFVANAALVYKKGAIIAQFRPKERRPEEPHFKEWFERNGYDVLSIPPDVFFEGAGDALLDRGRDATLFVGHGIRSQEEAAPAIAAAMDLEVHALRLVDPRFYHLDTCFCPLTGGNALYFPGGFDDESRARIESFYPAEKRFAVEEEDALGFACNAVDTGSAVLLNMAGDALQARLRSWGLEPVITPLTEFLLAGGAAKCLTLRLNEP